MSARKKGSSPIKKIPAFLDPSLNEAWNKGKQAGYNQAADIFHAFLNERIQTLREIEGIGEKTVEKVYKHLHDGMKK